VTPPPEEPSGGRLAPVSAGALTVWAIAGLVLGWVLPRVLGRLDRTSPAVTWTQVLVLFFVAAVLGSVAWSTRRSIRDRTGRPEAHRMVNRLVLARACALVGALLAGGYGGNAVAWLGVPSERAGERLTFSLLALLGAVAMVVAALLLERACRIPGDPDDA
jgi:hypothetical protein